MGVYLCQIGMKFFKLGFEQLLDKNSQFHWDIVNRIINEECINGKSGEWNANENSKEEIKGIKGIKTLIVTESGQYVHINCELIVDGGLSVKQVNAILDKVKIKLYSDQALNIQHLGIVPIPDMNGNDDDQ